MVLNIKTALFHLMLLCSFCIINLSNDIKFFEACCIIHLVYCHASMIVWSCHNLLKKQLCDLPGYLLRLTNFFCRPAVENS